jgi:hypothetical protein
MDAVGESSMRVMEACSDTYWNGQRTTRMARASNAWCSRLCGPPFSAWSAVSVATNSEQACQAETHQRAGKGGAPVVRTSQTCHQHQRTLGRRSPAMGHDQRERTRPHHGNRATRCEDQPQNREIDSGCTLVVLLSAQDDENRPPKSYPDFLSPQNKKTRWEASFRSMAVACPKSAN